MVGGASQNRSGGGNVQRRGDNVMMRRDLKEMVVVITGSSAGIGKALAERLGNAGAKLVLSARRMDRLEELNRSLGGAHLCIRADVAETADCRSLIEQSVARFGRIDTLVCNAGYGIYKRIAETTPDDTRKIFATNLLGTTDCIYFATPLMQKQEARNGFRGQIMIVSSFVGRRGIPFIGMYSATKFAQLGLAEALRSELEPSQIAVTSVHPIQTKTEFGQVAESLGGVNLPGAPVGQTVTHVTYKMTQAIIKPRPEVWPSPASRWVAGIGTLFPRLANRAVSNYRKKVEAANPR